MELYDASSDFYDAPMNTIVRIVINILDIFRKT